MFTLNRILFALFMVCVCVAVTWAANVLIVPRCRLPTPRQPMEFSKKIVLILLINGTVWIYLSYILAFLGKDEIAETLSKTVVTEVLGVFAAYAVKALLENMSKNNSWPDKPSGTKNNDIDC